MSASTRLGKNTENFRKSTLYWQRSDHVSPSTGLRNNRKKTIYWERSDNLFAAKNPHNIYPIIGGVRIEKMDTLLAVMQSFAVRNKTEKLRKSTFSG